MKRPLVRAGVALCLIALGSPAIARPYEGGAFKGRIAWSADGNHNDPDDWIASPLALAIFASTGLKDRLVHFDYNCILPQTNPEWERTHAESVLGAAQRYGYDTTRFIDCRQRLDDAVASIVRAINASSADDPLYFVVAGPMEVPYLGIQKSDPARRKFVYCVSHSRWNEGFSSQYKFTFTKRNVIEEDVHWVQISDQNRLLAFGAFGRPSPPGEFAPYFWLRDSGDPVNRWLWERMVVSTRPDPSDAGMAWFVATGDETCDPAKLRALLEERRAPPLVDARARVRLEAENFRVLENAALNDRTDRTTSHRLDVQFTKDKPGQIRTRFDEPFAHPRGRYDVEVRCWNEKGSRNR